MNQLISIIIPTYNRAHIIGETLDSILTQTYINWECIIVDDGSTDNTENIINDYISKDGRFKFFKRPEDKLKGPNSCRNFGFEKSQGLFVHFMDSDDLFHPYSLNIYMNSFNINLSADVVVANVEQIDFTSGLSSGVSTIFSNNLLEDFYVGNVIFYISGPLWKRNFLQNQDELFDNKITRLDDWDFNIRMLLSKPHIVFLNVSLIQYRKHADSLNTEVSKLNVKEIESHLRAKYKIQKIFKEKKINSGIDFEGDLIIFYKLIYKKAITTRNLISKKFFILLAKNYIINLEITKLFFLFLSYKSFKLIGRGYFFLKKI